MKNKVAIVGLVEDLGRAAPFHDKAFDIWTLNSGFRVYEGKRIDLVFEIHDWWKADYIAKYYLELQEMKRRRFDVITARRDEKLGKRQLMYPLDKAVQRFGWFLKSSLSFMLAYASLRGYEEAYVCGCNMAEFLRHPEMLASFYYIKGKAEAFGMMTYFLTSTTLDDLKLYGYEDLVWEKADIVGDSIDNYVLKDAETWEVKGESADIL